ncbi:hypothetical protein YC2023_082506 [Brassica napus]
MARYVYGLIFLIANLLAWAARDYGRGALNKHVSWGKNESLSSINLIVIFFLDEESVTETESEES